MEEKETKYSRFLRIPNSLVPGVGVIVESIKTGIVTVWVKLLLTDGFTSFKRGHLGFRRHTVIHQGCFERHQ